MTKKKNGNTKNGSGKFRSFQLTPSLSFLTLILITVAAGIGKISMSNAITEMNYTYEIRKREEMKLQQIVAELNSQIMELSRPDRIRAYARKNLGMIEYKPDTRILKVD